MRARIVLLCLVTSCVGEISDATLQDVGADLAEQPDADPADAQAAEVGQPDADPMDTGADVGLQDTGVVTQSRLMYVSVGAEPRLAVVTLNTDGSMTARSDWDLTLPDRPGAITFARAARRLYVGVRPGRIVTVALDAEGRPSILGETPDTGFPVFLDTLHDESVLVTTYFGDGVVKTHDISGTPPHAQTDVQTTTDEPHQSIVAPNGKVYVPHRSSDRTRWYDIATNGDITYGGELIAAAGVGPRHVTFSPDGTRAYLVNEFDDSVTLLSVAADGSLTAGDTVPTLPPGVDGTDNTCADIHVVDQGRLLYASNRGHDSVAGYRIEANGSLTTLGATTTEARPREFAISPDQQFIVVAGQDSGFLQSYRVDANGDLTSIDRLELGGDLRWVIID